MFLIVLTAGFILRLIALNQSLWLDEAININVARNLDYLSLITKYSLSDFHPPLYHVVLKFVISLLGSSEIAVRIPSVILGTGTVVGTYLIAKELFEKKTALIAATLVATAPLHIYYSQEARMYMLAAFFASFSVYFFIKTLTRDTLFNLLGFIIATSLMLYTDYLPYLLIPTYAVFLIINRKKLKGAIKTFLPSFIIIFLTLTPWLVIFPQQLKGGLGTAANSPAWANVVGSPQASTLLLTFVKFTIGRISVDNNISYAILFAPIGFFVILLLSLSFFRMSPKRSFLWYWFAVPIALAFAVSFYIPIFSYFRFIFVLPAFYILWAAAINTINWPRFVRIMLLFALVINIGSTVIYLENPKFHRENWRDATAYVSANSNKDSTILFEADFPTGPFDYYNSSNLQAYGVLTNFNAKPQEVQDKINLYTQNKNKVFLFQYLTQITDPNGLVFQTLLDNGYKNSKTTDFTGVGFVYEFQK